MCGEYFKYLNNIYNIYNYPRRDLTRPLSRCATANTQASRAPTSRGVSTARTARPTGPTGTSHQYYTSIQAYQAHNAQFHAHSPP